MRNVLFQPICFGSVTLKNCISFAPTSMPLSPAERIAKYVRVARSGVGLITVGDVGVLPSVRGLSILTPEGRDAFRALTDAVHAAGAAVSAQLFCPDYDVNAVMRMIRSGSLSHTQIKAEMDRGVKDFVTNLPHSRIAEIVSAFALAAKAAQEAGFDLVQIHGDRLAGSFSSSIYNVRDDCYGGSPQNRARFACEVVRAVRDAVPLPIDYKLAVRQENPHYGNAGVLFDELDAFVPLLEAAGADGFHVTMANHSKLEDSIPPAGHPHFKGEGCFLYLADEVKRHTRLPVSGVGRLTDPAFIEHAIASGRIEMAALSRQMIADDGWLEKIAQNREAEIRRCVACNRMCLGALENHTPFGCILNKEELQ